MTATSAPSLASLKRSHLPNRGSFDVAATTTSAFFSSRLSPASRPLGALTGATCVSRVGRSDGAVSWSELTNPGASIVARGEKDRRRSSIFHRRIWPSHEPEAKTSPYGRHASAVIHRGVPIMPSVSDSCSLMPCASWTVKMGFFFVIDHRQMDLATTALVPG